MPAERPRIKDTGYIVGPRPTIQQVSLVIGAIVVSIAIGVVVTVLDTPPNWKLPRV